VPAAGLPADSGPQDDRDDPAAVLPKRVRK